jgi:hypothetical protein
MAFPGLVQRTHRFCFHATGHSRRGRNGRIGTIEVWGVAGKGRSAAGHVVCPAVPAQGAEQLPITAHSGRTPEARLSSTLIVPYWGA